MTNLQAKLIQGRFVLTAEVTPPVSADRRELTAKALPLKGLADAVNVTDGAGARSHLSAVTAAAMLLEAGIEPILQFTCRDRNRIALQSELMGAAASGVRNLLILRGDDPSAGDQPDAKPVFDLDPRQLLETARRLRDLGELPSGRKVSGSASFFLGGADNPIDPPPGWEPKALQGKIAAGAQFVQTQFCMDTGVVRRYMARLAEHGIADRLKFLIGVVPLRSAPSSPTRSSIAWRLPPIRRRKATASASKRCANCRKCRTSPACTSWRRTTTPRFPPLSRAPASSSHGPKPARRPQRTDRAPAVPKYCG